MDFVFQISPYSDPSLLRQVSEALEKRTELRARAQCPRLWSVTDTLNKRKKTVSKGQRIRYRIYGVLLTVMGVMLLIPGMMEPKTLWVPLIAGAIGILLGVFTLWAVGASQRQRTCFDQAAEKLLKGFAMPPSAQVNFGQNGMEIAGKPAASYPDFDFVAETKDLFLLTWKEKVTLLQKKDLVAGESAQFAGFLRAKIKDYGAIYHVVSC